MRLSLEVLPQLLLLALPVYAVANDWDVVSTVLALALWIIVRQAVVFYNIKGRMDDDHLVLETMPVSHFCEKVRWCLDRMGVAYYEEVDTGLIGVFFTGRMLRVPGKNISIQNSSDILRYLYGLHCHDEARAGFLKPTAEALALESRLDKFGIALRRYAYYNAVIVPSAGGDTALSVWGLNNDLVPQWQKTVLKLTFPALRAFLINKLKLNAKGAEDALRRCKLFLGEMDALLSDGREFLLATPEPSYVDFTFASLAAILALPENYAGSKVLNEESRPRLDMATPEMQKEVRAFRETPAGKLVLKMYKAYR